MAVLYRTYRPAKWSEVMGQEDVVKTLSDSIANGRISHAYLFSGSRGTGKTTVARIYAHELGTSADDVYEIDAASNRGIDDIRDLRQHVSALPFGSKYKVYIIDEVHMLSKDAWNALLKTIEEPPEHVIFILATTELDKVPETIVSRCQTFTFRRPTREVIRKQVTLVAKKEGYELDQGGGELIAVLGDGSFRDALGMLEKVITGMKGKKITREAVETVTDAPRAELVNMFIEGVLMKDSDNALRVLSDVDSHGVSVATFATLMLEKMRFIMLVQYSKSSESSIRDRVSDDDWEFVSREAGKKVLTPAILAVVLEAVDAIDRARVKILPLEIAVARICGIV